MYTHNFVAAVGATQYHVGAAGNYVRYVSVSQGSSYPTIRIRTPSGGDVHLMPGQAITFPEKFSGFNVFNVDGVSSIAGELLVGEGSMSDDRVNGEVLNIDGSYSRSLQLQAYSLSYEMPATAAMLGHAQLYNSQPTKHAVVTGVYVSLPAAGAAKFSLREWTVLGGIPSVAAIPKFGGAAVGTTAVRTLTNAVPFGTLVHTFGADQVGTELKFDEPFIVPIGRGLIVCCHTVNLAFDVTWNFFEIPVP